MDYKICNHKCDIYKISWEFSLINCSKNQKCNTYIYEQKICQYIIKKYYVICIVKKKKCENCEKLLPKCTTMVITSLFGYN